MSLHRKFSGKSVDGKSILTREPPITDLRSPTAFTYTNVVTDINGCATFPTTVYDTFTLVAAGSTYLPKEILTHVLSTAPALYVPATFPGLIMTNLKPGERMTLVKTFNLFHSLTVVLDGNVRASKPNTHWVFLVLLPHSNCVDY